MAASGSTYFPRPLARPSAHSNIKLTKFEHEVIDLAKNAMKKTYKCFWNPSNAGSPRMDCDAHLVSFSVLEKHTRKHAERGFNVSKRKWVCCLPNCTYRDYDSQMELEEHITRSHLQTRYLLCPILSCVETSKHHDKLANHFRTAHGVNLAALSNELGPLYKGIPIVTPTPIEPLPAHIDSYRPSLPTIRKATKRSRHSDRHQRKDEDEEMNSLFGSGSSRSDSKSKLPAVAGSSSSSCLVPLPPSPRKKRGARITRAIVDPDVVPPNPTYLAEDDLVYGDAPGGEYAPREGYRIWEPTPWLDMEKPEMATYKNPLPPVYHRVRSVYPTPPVTQLDREPVVITRHIGVGTEPEGNQQQAQSPSAPATSTPLDVNSGVKRGQPIGFVALWEAMRSTPVGQTLDAARKKEAAEEAVKELAKAAQAARRLAGRKHPDTASWEPSLSSDIPPIMQEDSSANALPVTPKRRLGLQTARKHGTRPCLLGAVSIQASGSPPSLPSPSLDVNGSSASSGSLPTTLRRPAGLQSARKTGSKPSHVIRLSDADKRLRITSPEEGGGAQ